MITLTFILIAYMIRKRFLSEDASGWEKVLYYSVSVVLTPLLGPWLFSKLSGSDLSGDKDPKKYGYSMPDF